MELTDPAYARGVHPPVAQIMDGSSDTLPRVLPQPSNFAVPSRPPVTPSSLNWIGGSGPSRCRTTFSPHWTSPRKGGQMIRRWRCSNTESFVNENQVCAFETPDNLAVRLIGIPRFAVSSPGLLREGDPAPLQESARPQVLPFSASCV